MYGNLAAQRVSDQAHAEALGCGRAIQPGNRPPAQLRRACSQCELAGRVLMHYTLCVYESWDNLKVVLQQLLQAVPLTRVDEVVLRLLLLLQAAIAHQVACSQRACPLGTSKVVPDVVDAILEAASGGGVAEDAQSCIKAATAGIKAWQQR